MNWPTPPTLAPRRQESECSRSPNENRVAVLVVLKETFACANVLSPDGEREAGLVGG